jgi:trigger factor
VADEVDRLRESARQDWRHRTGQDVSQLELPADLFEEQAKKRVALGLILTEVVEKNGLKADPAQVRAHIEELAESYESPEEMVKWYYSDPRRVQESESVVLEDNVVTWALGQMQVTDKPVGFQELINNATA